MGVHKNITATAFPPQSAFVGKPTFVCFHYGNEEFKAEIIRDDTDEPFRTVLKLEDGRVVLGTECQYKFPLSVSLNVDE